MHGDSLWIVAGGKRRTSDGSKHSAAADAQDRDIETAEVGNISAYFPAGSTARELGAFPTEKGEPETWVRIPLLELRDNADTVYG